MVSKRTLLLLNQFSLKRERKFGLWDKISAWTLSGSFGVGMEPYLRQCVESCKSQDFVLVRKLLGAIIIHHPFARLARNNRLLQKVLKKRQRRKQAQRKRPSENKALRIKRRSSRRALQSNWKKTQSHTIYHQKRINYPVSWFPVLSNGPFKGGN